MTTKKTLGHTLVMTENGTHLRMTTTPVLSAPAIDEPAHLRTHDAIDDLATTFMQAYAKQDDTAPVALRALHLALGEPASIIILLSTDELSVSTDHFRGVPANQRVAMALDVLQTTIDSFQAELAA